MEVAAAEKHRLEEKQRAARKIKEQMQVIHKPKWFTECEDEISGEKTYKFNDKYWDKRKKMDYADFPDLF